MTVTGKKERQTDRDRQNLEIEVENVRKTKF